MFAKIKSWLNEKWDGVKAWWQRRTSNGVVEALKGFGKDLMFGALVVAGVIEFTEALTGFVMLGAGQVALGGFVLGLVGWGVGTGISWWQNREKKTEVKAGKVETGSFVEAETVAAG